MKVEIDLDLEELLLASDEIRMSILKVPPVWKATNDKQAENYEKRVTVLEKIADALKNAGKGETK